MKRFVALSFLCVLWCFSGCRSDAVLEKQAVVVIEPGPFIVSIPARGELRAVKSTRIKGAANINGPQVLAWMAPENSWVKKDEPVVRMDPTWFEEQVRSETANVTRLNIEIRHKELQMAKEKSDMVQQVELTSIERGQADLYAARDESIYPRNKIIEDSINLDFLTQKSDHYKTILARLEKKARTEMQLLELKKKSSEIKLQQHKQALNALEIRAPHDGLFIYSKNWRGEKPQIGMNVWSGYQLAELPDLSLMEAVIHVHESESAGLASGLPVNIFPEAYPTMVLTGQVDSVAQVANPIDSENPSKFFEVKVKLQPGSWGDLRPGSLINCQIEALRLDQVIAIPNQALQNKDGKIWVVIQHDGKMERRAVETGQRSITRTVVTTGLNRGDAVLLGSPMNGQEGGN